MSTKKITELTNLATPVGADVLPIVDDVAGTPVTKKVTATNLMSLAPVQSVAGQTGTVTLSNTDISGLGTAATQDVGTSSGNVVQLDSTGLPAIDGSQLTNLPATTLSYATQTYTASGTPLAFTLTSAAQGKVVTVNESNDVYVSVPTGLGAGFNCRFVQMGAGKVIVEGSGGAAVQGYTPGASRQNTTIGQYSVIDLVPTSTDNYVITGDATTAPFLNTYALTLDGVDDHATVGTVSEMNSVTNLSISWWMKSGGASDYIFRNSSNQTFFRTQSAGIFCRINNVSNTLGSIDYNDSTWRHFAFTLASGTGTLYVNGSSVGSASNYGTTTSSTAGTSFQISNASGGLVGGMDEIGIFSSTLGASEVTAIYNSGVPADLLSDSGNYTSSSNLEHYWRGGDNDNGTGSTMTDVGNSSSLLDATLVNGASFTTDTP